MFDLNNAIKTGLLCLSITALAACDSNDSPEPPNTSSANTSSSAQSSSEAPQSSSEASSESSAAASSESSSEASSESSESSSESSSSSSSEVIVSSSSESSSSSSEASSSSSESSSSSSESAEDRGKRLMQSSVCVGCHADNEDGTWTGSSAAWDIDVNDLNNATDESSLASYIEANMPQVDVTACDATCASDIAAYMWSYRSAPEINLVTDGDFEASGDLSWYTWNYATLSRSTAQAVSGTQSMLVSDRPEGGVAAYSLSSVVAAGNTYNVSAQVMINGTDPGVVRITGSVGCDGEDTAYSWVVNNDAVAPDTWTPIAGTLEVPVGCTVTTVQIYFEGTAAAIDLYVDDVLVTLVE